MKVQKDAEMEWSGFIEQYTEEINFEVEEGELSPTDLGRYFIAKQNSTLRAPRSF